MRRSPQVSGKSNTPVERGSDDMTPGGQTRGSGLTVSRAALLDALMPETAARVAPLGGDEVWLEPTPDGLRAVTIDAAVEVAGKGRWPERIATDKRKLIDALSASDLAEVVLWYADYTLTADDKITQAVALDGHDEDDIERPRGR
jgi:hypothetical protein